MASYRELRLRIRKAIAGKDEPWVRKGTLADLADLHARGWVETDMDVSDYLFHVGRFGSVKEECEKIRAAMAWRIDAAPLSDADWIREMKAAP